MIRIYPQKKNEKWGTQNHVYTVGMQRPSADTEIRNWKHWMEAATMPQVVRTEGELGGGKRKFFCGISLELPCV